MIKTSPHTNIELMAPAGSFASLTAAIKAGCNSVYFGIQQLNMRAKSSQNFTLQDLHTITNLCQKNNVKTYLTLNTLLYDHDLQLAYKIIDEAKKVNVTAIIVSDMAAILYANEIDQPVHISTQQSVSNIEMVKFFAKYAEMIVLARELTLPMQKKICEQIKQLNIRGRHGKLMKIEIFGHGAMCIAYSGRCHMSLLTDNSSANRGACTQNCRRAYLITDLKDKTSLKLENNYVMSPTDLCTIGLLDEIVKTGIATLKIEGRGRSADYVETVITCYREALNAIKDGTYTKSKIKKWNKRLGTVYNRGLSKSYYLGKPFIEWSGSDGNKANQRKDYVGIVKKYYPKAKIAEVEVLSNSFSENDKYIFIGDTTGVVRGKKPIIWLDEKIIPSIKQGHIITFKVPHSVKKGDRLYKLTTLNNND